jgi:hypothetical protein
MTRSKVIVDKNIKRPPGRPRTGQHPALSARVPQKVLDGLDKWAADNSCTRSEAIAHMLERGLASAHIDAKIAANRAAHAAKPAPAKPRRRAKPK